MVREGLLEEVREGILQTCGEIMSQAEGTASAKTPRSEDDLGIQGTSWLGRLRGRAGGGER